MLQGRGGCTSATVLAIDANEGERVAPESKRSSRRGVAKEGERVARANAVASLSSARRARELQRDDALAPPTLRIDVGGGVGGVGVGGEEPRAAAAAAAGDARAPTSSPHS